VSTGKFLHLYDDGSPGLD